MTAAVIGGGAAGLAAGCLLARAGVDTVIYEKQERVGRKLLSTGNGRCNLTNMNASPRDYHGSREHVGAALDALSPADAVSFFESLGVDCVADEEGRVYPRSNMAAGVLDALRLYAAENGCRIETGFDVSGVTHKGGGFIVASADGRRERAEYVLICCGGLAAPKLGGCADGYALLKAFGHNVTARHPAIAPLKTDADAVRSLKGIRARGEIALIADGKEVRREAGEILFNDGVISGIAAMQLCRDANLMLARGVKCFAKLDLMPGADADAMKRRAKLLPERAADDLLSGVVPKRLGQLIMKRAGVKELSLKARELTEKQLDAVQRELTSMRLPVTGTQGFESAQVTCGGVAAGEFDPATLESKRRKGLFAAGEVLDVDGDCGGFNLQWAWASAYLAASEIVRRAKSR